MVFHIGPKLVGRRVLPLAHPKEGDEGLVEAPDLRLQLFVKLVPLLPIPSLDGIYVFRGGIVEVHRQVLFERLLADLGQNLRLFLGTIGLAGVLVLAPQVCKHVSVFIHGRGIEHADKSQHGGYQ